MNVYKSFKLCVFFFVIIVFTFEQLYIFNNRLYRSNNFNVNDLINMLIIFLSIEM